jgi:hypothetical protein
MQIFKDRHGHQWVVELNVAQQMRVKAALGVNVFDLFDMQGLAALATDLIKLCNILWVLCERQAKERGISEEGFGEALAGDSLDDAFTAFTQELIDFFPRKAERENIRRAVAKTHQINQRVQERAVRKIEEIDVDRLVDEAEKEVTRLSQGGTRSAAGDSPVSSESTPSP